MIQIIQAFWELLNFLSSRCTCLADFSASHSESEQPDLDGYLHFQATGQPVYSSATPLPVFPYMTLFVKIRNKLLLQNSKTKNDDVLLSSAKSHYRLPKSGYGILHRYWQKQIL